MLTHLNNKDYKRMSIQYKKDFYCTGFDKDTLIKMKVGYKKIKGYKFNKNMEYLTKAFQRRFRRDLVDGKIDKECLTISKNLISHQKLNLKFCD